MKMNILCVRARMWSMLLLTVIYRWPVWAKRAACWLLARLTESTEFWHDECVFQVRVGDVSVIHFPPANSVISLILKHITAHFLALTLYHYDTPSKTFYGNYYTVRAFETEVLMHWREHGDRRIMVIFSICTLDILITLIACWFFFYLQQESFGKSVAHFLGIRLIRNTLVSCWLGDTKFVFFENFKGCPKWYVISLRDSSGQESPLT